MARTDFTVIERGGPHGSAIDEIFSFYPPGMQTAPGSTKCLLCELNGTMAAGEGRLFLMDSLNVTDASGSCYVYRNWWSSGVSAVGHFIAGRANLASTSLADFTGYLAEVDKDGSGSVTVSRYDAGTPTLLGDTGSGAYILTPTYWFRMRLTLKDVGVNTMWSFQYYSSGTWNTWLSGVDAGSTLNGVAGSFGFGVFDSLGGATGYVGGIDDFLCEEVL